MAEQEEDDAGCGRQIFNGLIMHDLSAVSIVELAMLVAARVMGRDLLKRPFFCTHLSIGTCILPILLLSEYVNLACLSDSIRSKTLCANDLRVEYIPIDYHKRTGRSKNPPHPHTTNILLTIIRTIIDFNPLKICLPIGVIFFLLAIGVLAFSGLYLNRIMDAQSPS